MSEERLITPKVRPGEVATDAALRPRSLADYLGQDQVKHRKRPRLRVTVLLRASGRGPASSSGPAPSQGEEAARADQAASILHALSVLEPNAFSMSSSVFGNSALMSK